MLGEAFTRALATECPRLAPVLWEDADPIECTVLVGYYESAGWKFCFRANAHGYSGTFQRAPTRDGTLYVDLPGKRDLAVQVRDYVDFTLAQIRTFAKGRRIQNLGQLYCLNLAPAYVLDRVVYAHPKAPWPMPDGKPRAVEPGLLAEIESKARRHPGAYAAQDAHLDPQRKGWIEQVDLAAPILANRGRVEDEIAAARAYAVFPG